MKVVCLPGDGIGPEVMASRPACSRSSCRTLELEERPFGGAADPRRATTRCLPQRSRPAGRRTRCCWPPSGVPELDDAEVRPEQGLLRTPPGA